MKISYWCYIIVFVFIISPALLIGQSSGLSEWNLHGFTGINFSTISHDEDSDTNSRLGLDLGIGVEREFFGFPIIARILFSQRGAKWSWEGYDYGGDFKGESKERINYLSIPVMVKYPILQGYVLAGPQMSFLLGGKEKLEETWGGVKDKWEADVKEYKKGVDFGLVFGGGYPIPCSWREITVEVMYYFGLMDINDWEDDDHHTYKNRALLVGVTIPITK
ncbi:porin family protein [Candidatus Neomarinimicrobiota bacterium]